jgi:hypothetical protein
VQTRGQKKRDWLHIIPFFPIELYQERERWIGADGKSHLIAKKPQTNGSYLLIDSFQLSQTCIQHMYNTCVSTCARV